jgi:TrwC relaxase
VLAAHHAGVREAVAYLDTHVGTRRGHAGVQHVSGQGLLAVGFDHRTSREGDPLLHTHLVIQVEAMARGRPIDEGGYLWRGESRLWDNEILMGWYAATDGSVRSKGTMYFVMHPHGISMTAAGSGLATTEQ